jgi:hypothetical protein
MTGYEHLLNPALLRVEKLRDTERPWLSLRRFLALLGYLISRIFSCWHRRMSRPFTRDGETYRVCLRCGMQRQFDLAAWQTRGGYYNEMNEIPSSSQTRNECVAAAPGRKLRLIA